MLPCPPKKGKAKIKNSEVVTGKRGRTKEESERDNETEKEERKEREAAA